MNLIFIPSPDPGRRNEREWRGFQLARAVQNTRHSSASLLTAAGIGKPTFKEKALLQSADAVVVEASPDPAVLATIQHLKMLNQIVFLDLVPGKAFSSLKPVAETFPGAEGPVEETAFQLEAAVQWQMRLADAVFSPSMCLLDDIRAYARGIVLPEYIDLERYVNIGKAAHPGIVLGWRNASLDPKAGLGSGLQTALERICRARPAVRVEIFGGDPALPRSMALPPGAVRYFRGPAEGSWPAPLSHIDIGLAPLSGDLDQRRGWLDVLEFMAMKIPWIASQGSPYFELRSYGWVVENSPATWERVLLDIIDHLQAYSDEAEGEPYLFTVSQGIDEKIEAVVGKFAETCAQVRSA